MIRIGKAGASDIRDIAAFLSAQGFNQKDMEREKDWFVYYDGPKLIGCGAAFSLAEYCFIDFIMIDEKFRRNKCGTAIVKTILNYYECNGAKYALSNGEQKFFESLGFNPMPIDKLPDYVRNSLAAINAKQIYGVSLEGYFKGCC